MKLKYIRCCKCKQKLESTIHFRSNNHIKNFDNKVKYQRKELNTVKLIIFSESLWVKFYYSDFLVTQNVVKSRTTVSPWTFLFIPIRPRYILRTIRVKAKERGWFQLNKKETDIILIEERYEVKHREESIR